MRERHTNGDMFVAQAASNVAHGFGFGPAPPFLDAFATLPDAGIARREVKFRVATASIHISEINAGERRARGLIHSGHGEYALVRE